MALYCVVVLVATVVVVKYSMNSPSLFISILSPFKFTPAYYVSLCAYVNRVFSRPLHASPLYPHSRPDIHSWAREFRFSRTHRPTWHWHRSLSHSLILRARISRVIRLHRSPLVGRTCRVVLRAIHECTLPPT